MKKAILFGIAGLFLAGATYAQHKGTDNYKYEWKSSKDIANGVNGHWIDITTRQGAKELTNRFTDDSNFGPINFSFDFPYYWYKRNYLYIGSNGYIHFQDKQIAAPFPNVPGVEGDAGDDFIGPFLCDLTFTNLDGSRVTDAKLYFYTDFKDTMIVSWLKVPFFNSAGTAAGGSHSFQVILERNGTITYNYIESVGSQDAQACVLTGDGEACIMIGNENVNGKVGMNIKRQTDDDPAVTNYFLGVSASAPVTIRCARPDSSDYKVRDLSVLWNNNPTNGGVFAVKGGDPVALNSMIINQGLQANPENKAVVTGDVFDETNKSISKSSKNLKPLQSLETELLTFSNTIPTDKEGIFRFQSKISWSNADLKGDEISGNNTLSQQVRVVDIAKTSYDLNYNISDDDGDGTISWVGGNNYNVGIGTYIEPPVYPVIVKGVNIWLNNGVDQVKPASGIQLEVYDNDGKNLFDEFDGSPGTRLAKKTILPIDLVEGPNRIALDTPFQINSGGVYIAALQCGQAVGVLVESRAPIAYRSYEVTKDLASDKAFFSTYRKRITEDPMIGIEVTKGDLGQTLDLALDSILYPTKDAVITDDSIQVIIRIHNVGVSDVKGPFRVRYEADGNTEVIENVDASVTVAVGQAYDYTFKKHLRRPPAPRTNYKEFCTEVNAANDFVEANNTNCYQTSTGVSSSENALNNLIVYPNPNQGTFNVFYGLREQSNLKFEVYDARGKVIEASNLGRKPVGFYDFNIDLKGLPAGIYFYRMVSDNGVISGKLSIVN